MKSQNGANFTKIDHQKRNRVAKFIYLPKNLQFDYDHSIFDPNIFENIPKNGFEISLY